MDSALERRTIGAEDRHWWYLGRSKVVMDAARRAVAGASAPRILDAGCGGGAMLSELAGLGPTTGLEPSPRSRDKALSRGVADVVDGGLEGLPFPAGAFDLALALDVLEHVDDDISAFGELHRVVTAGGALVVTVPAHPRLWSGHDEANHHRRRYTRSRLRDAAVDGGWDVVRLTHFMTALLPAALIARRVGRGDGLQVPRHPVNRALRATIEAEAALIRRGITFPLGLSLLAELRR